MFSERLSQTLTQYCLRYGQRQRHSIVNEAIWICGLAEFALMFELVKVTSRSRYVSTIALRYVTLLFRNDVTEMFAQNCCWRWQTTFLDLSSFHCHRVEVTFLIYLMIQCNFFLGCCVTKKIGWFLTALFRKWIGVFDHSIVRDGGLRQPHPLTMHSAQWVDNGDRIEKRRLASVMRFCPPLKSRITMSIVRLHCTTAILHSSNRSYSLHPGFHHGR